MFTGIVEATGAVHSHVVNDGLLRLVVERPVGWEIALGQSIAVNGVCLTVVLNDDTGLTFELMQETLTHSLFGDVIPARVNLERAMMASGRFDGHLMQGHVDAVGAVKGLEKKPDSWLITINYQLSQAALLIPKGSIAVNGISLTVAEKRPDTFTVAIIPHTISHTTIADMKVGDMVNLEFDMIGKYILNK